MKRQETKKGTLVGFAVGAIFFALFYYGAQQIFKPDMESKLREVALELNKETPMHIDEFTRLDSAASSGEANLTYYYTLHNLEKAEVNLDTVNKYVRTNLIENARSNPELKVLRDNKVTMDYKYFDKNREFVIEISVTPNLYNNH